MLNSTIYNALNVSGITALLGTYKTKTAIFSDALIPQDCTAEKTINFYASAPYSGVVEYSELIYTINCRAKTMKDSQTIAAAVRTAINRVSGIDYYITVDIIPTIPPADDRDNYNTPVEAKLKKR